MTRSFLFFAALCGIGVAVQNTTSAAATGTGVGTLEISSPGVISLNYALMVFEECSNDDVWQNKMDSWT